MGDDVILEESRLMIAEIIFWAGTVIWVSAFFWWILVEIHIYRDRVRRVK